MKKLIILFILIASIATADTRLVVGTEYSKGVNDSAGLEILIKGTTNINNRLDLKYGVSEQFAAHRSSPYSFNHDGRRFDIGFLVNVDENLKVGYTHSERNAFPGANTDSIYYQNSVDTLGVRYEFNL